MRAMRTVLAGFVIMVIALAFAGLPLLMAGKSTIPMLAAGHPLMSPRATTLAAGVAAGFAALWMLLHLAAHRHPRQYFPLMRWSRYSMAVAIASLLFAGASVVYRQMVYGLGA
jgi:hypothetical protein